MAAMTTTAFQRYGRALVAVALAHCAAANPRPTSSVVGPIVIAPTTVFSLQWVVLVVGRSEPLADAPQARARTHAVSLAYGRYVRATRLAQSRRVDVRRFEQLAQLAQQRFSTGSAPRGDVDASQQATRTAEIASLAAEDDLRGARESLGSLLRQPRGAELPPPADLAAVTAHGDLESWLALARTHRAADDPDRVRRDVTAAHERLVALVASWNQGRAEWSTPESIAWDAPRARYTSGLITLGALVEAVDAAGRMQRAITDLAARIADASADLELAVGAPLPREPLPSPSE